MVNAISNGKLSRGASHLGFSINQRVNQRSHVTKVTEVKGNARNSLEGILRRNPLENRVIVPTSGQKSHHLLGAKLWCHKAF